MSVISELSGIPLTHRRERLNGIGLHWVEAGVGEPVVLLHGFPDFWFGWRMQIPALCAAGRRVIVPDLRGYNDSEKPRDVSAYAMSQLVGDVAALIDHAAYGNAVVVGHDWGGVIAWHLAARHPERVRRLIILNAPHPARYREELKHLRQLRRSWYALLFQLPRLPEALLRARNFAVLRDILLRSEHHMSEEHFRRYVRAFETPLALTSALNYYRAAAQGLRRERKSRSAPVSTRVEVPTLVIWGMRDPALGPHLLDDLDRHVASVKVERLRYQGHFVHWEKPETVGQLMLNFL